MRNVFKVISAAAIIGITAAFFPGAASAQDLFGGLSSNSKRKGPKKPLKITSETLDVDMPKNIAVFTGSVFVDDDDMTITCHKLTIFLEEKDQGDAGMKKEENKDPVSSEMAGNKELKKIVCEKDVVIRRKVYDPTEKAKGTQQATGGKAVYDVKLGQIELTEDNPKITRGDDSGVSADKITMWRESGRFSASGNVKTWFPSEMENGEKKETPAEAPAKETDSVQQETKPQTEPQEQQQEQQVIQEPINEEKKVERKAYTGNTQKTEDEKADQVDKIDVRSVISSD